MLSIAVERNARNPIEGSFFSHITRIGNHTFGVSCKISKRQIIERLNHLDSTLMITLFLISLKCEHEAQGFTSKRSNYLHSSLARLFIYDRNERFHLINVIDDGLAVQGQNHIFAFFQMKLVHDFRTLHFRLKEADIVDKHISYHINLRQFCTFLVGDAVVRNACGKKDI